MKNEIGFDESFYKALERIEQASGYEINDLADAVQRRYAVLFPDWEIMFLSVRREPEQRREDIAQTIEFLNKMCE